MAQWARKSLAWLLLALYGGISLLGYGLHEFAPGNSHHHHLGLTEAQSGSGPLAFRSGGVGEDGHDCDVCVFLDQARSERPQIATAVVCQHFVAAVEFAAPRLTSQATLGLHAPRGPPTFLG